MNRFTLSLAPIDLALGLCAHLAVAVTSLAHLVSRRYLANPQ